MATKQVNGEAPSSAFLSHLYSYPVISDSLSTLNSQPIFVKSLSLTTQLTHSLTNPLLPYLRTPLTYASPYLSRADTLGDSTLNTIDHKFPVVKKPTNELLDDGKALVWFPYKKGSEGKEYVFNVYGSECKKVGGEGVVTWGKAAIATGIVVTGDVFTAVSGYLAGKKQQGEKIVNEKTGN